MRQFAKAGAAPNTFIGGIAKQGGTGVNEPIDTPWKLSQKLGIAVNRITGFKVIGDDVECRIRGSYILPYQVFGDSISEINANQNITSYEDFNGLVSGTGDGGFCFARCLNLLKLKLNGISSLGNTSSSLFAYCNNSNLEVEMTGLTSVTTTFLIGLSNSFNQSKLTVPNITTISGNFIRTCYGFANINMSSVTNMTSTPFYDVRNCQSFIFNNVTAISSNSSGTWRHGNAACKLIELKKCKTLPNTLIGLDAATSIIHNSDFTMCMNEAVYGHTSLVAIKTAKPHAVIEFYDDSGNYVSTL